VAGSNGKRSDTAFVRSHALLQNIGRPIADARIDETDLLE
jgi:hypothetical protein